MHQLIYIGKQHAQEYIATKKPIMPSKHFISTYFLTFHNDPILAKTGGSETEDDSM